MKLNIWNFIHLSAALALSFSWATAGEVLVDENFDALNLNELPAGWSKAEPTVLSLVDEDGHGKVLKFANKDEKYPFLMVTLDPAKVAGRTIDVTVAAKFPGAYIPIADKLSASPKFIVEAKDGDGKTLIAEERGPQAGKPEWQELKKSVAIPQGAASVTLQLCVQFVTCEVFFDNVKVELGAADAVAAPAPAAVPVEPAKPTAAPAVAEAAKPAAPTAAPTPKSIAEKAPKKVIAESGLSFGPEYAVRLLESFPKKTAAAGTALFVGPGFTEKETQPKLPGTWKALPSSAKLYGAAATPRALLAVLPEVLAKEKPEVVFIGGDAAPGRKPTTLESDDWEDIANLCVRLGALPVAVSHSNDGKDETYDRISKAIDKAVISRSLLTVSATPPDQFAKRAGNLLTLLDTYVFMRTNVAEPGKPAAGKTPSGKPIEE